jgi:oligopeptide/dipeptide ABC transporter ATP-binding protein
MAQLSAPSIESDPRDAVLSVQGLTVKLATRRGAVALVEGLDFSIHSGETLGIVGESGSGKTITALAIMRLLPRQAWIAEGEIILNIDSNRLDLATAGRETMRQVRGARIAMIFQDPMTSLNPVLTVGRQILDALLAHGYRTVSEARKMALALLQKVHIPAPEMRLTNYPHEFSGGMRQRVAIAMGLANSPAVLIADEPTTALDVTVQAQILRLMQELTSSTGTATLLITHNLGIVAQQCTRVLVMYLGRIVEEGPVDAILGRPQHPYTYLLLKAVPRLDGADGPTLANIPGVQPALGEAPSGCKFANRCPFQIARCATDEPPLEVVQPGHRARCWVLMDNVPPNATALPIEGLTT